uniref:Adenosine kinase n=1 Tax=Aureoumbra lagunensis TaxID=44058 RepID=A0A7S3JWM6_9STRA|mmetsp:Transcript_8754/g.12157  ORF Transcript_8754/g.12157 Transcript_8754/m.12157 type:complete len:388 (-) Transcript_8754:358-1521(-)|eukprot:CAMPEP_0197293194 /NCGR_PEP_ID=MMETSP0890-20130614/27232_1 /TAXON_ID=44058 ORGANISM="Aureoumbra lagunensis, Strain CCMP1510" /NCGR_SAMPLE_ID=MMETSP0890 /ASSEMBLY_ACC=CAM_ASM_000533 /LENGTH=387 /DNA_ID=CAMNT_0042767727 /DNA_START=54 /DNA_END=1217 /DNA_ORIENTATION=-
MSSLLFGSDKKRSSQSSSEIKPCYFTEAGRMGPDHKSNVERGCLVLGVGNPLLDMSAKIEKSLLEKYQVKSGDIILAEEKHFGVYDELAAKEETEYIAGGATQNSMRVCAWMLKGKRENAVAFAGCVGEDDQAKKLQDCAADAGVTVAYMHDKTTPTGVCACLIDDTNERTLITRLDAANNYAKSHLESDELQTLLLSAKLVYSAGFFLTSGGPDCTKLLGEHCVKYHKRYCLNLSAPFIAQFFMSQLDATMPYVDILFGNETEAATLGEQKGWGSDLKVIALNAAAMPKASGTYARIVVITQGAQATIVAQSNTVTTYPVPPVQKAKIVDTNGAGDAMVGGFLSRFVLDESIENCVKAGHWAAATIIQRSGCTMPPKCTYGHMMPF